MTTSPNMDETAFASFYESTKHQLWLYIMKVAQDASVTDDMFQETYIRFLQRPAREKDERAMKSYLYRIATNLINDHWRRLKRDRKWFAGDAAEAPAANGAGQVEARQDIADALGHLAPQQRSMVWLAYVEEYTHREIAEMLKVKESSVKVLLHRAKQKLLEIFKHKGMTSEATP
jgi:RNA polymerase sigma-70 factor, ECF subfamily